VKRKQRAVTLTAYLQLIGLSTGTQPAPPRPYIAFACSALASASTDPRAIHYKAAGTGAEVPATYQGVGAQVHQRCASQELKGYSDSDWNNEPGQWLEQRGIHFHAGGGAISWHTKKLEGVATSATGS